ncbi:hypothetical protein [Clostridium uliginosum]|uniref:Outer membrane efflux protein n=1 Tax=Clostridium uliginosum TaxID=119641 RepID=A0A1I1J6G0_9CLOT|nr:hypothetical protein [Clostridium uliginosum]SFC41020.1 hypothetical protein SAMN05421842_103112 [Clostridium uliginosum]
MLKKIMICILSMLLILLNISGAEAATNNTIKVSLENIEEIMLKYSPDLEILDNNLNKAEEDYDDLVDRIKDLEDDRDKLEDKITESNNKASTSDAGINPGTGTTTVGPTSSPTDSKEHKDTDNDSLEGIKKKISTAKEEKDKARYDLKKARVEYDQKVKQSVFSAQKQYIDYLDTLSKKETKQADIKSQNNQNEVYKTKYEMGFISKKEYDTHARDNTDLDNDSKELTNKEETELKNLHLTLGVPLKTTIIFINDINADLDKISKINFQNDLDKMLEDNVSVQIKDIELDEAEDISDSDYDVDNAEISLKQEKEKVKLDFQKQYNNLMVSYNLIKSSNEKLNQKQYDFGVMQTKYNYGFVSKKQTEDLNLELDKQIKDFASIKNNLYVNYLRYIQMKSGY